MSRSPILDYVIRDANGSPVPGGELYTYESGTTTNKATYSDAAKATPNTNPLIAGNDGVIATAIYMTDGEAYKFVEKDASSNTLRTWDSFFSVMLTSSTQSERTSQIASSPLDYGAEGDGVADESSEVQSAIDGATAKVDLLGKTFRCDSAITLASGIKLVNGTLDFSNCTDDNFIIIHGSLETATTLTSDGTFDAALVSLTSVAGMASGDIINIYDDQTYTGTAVSGELAEIESISSLDVNVQQALENGYATLQNASARKVTTIDNVLLEDLTVIGAESVSGTHAVVSVIGGRRFRMNRCRMEGIDSYGLRIAGSYDVIVSNCSFADGITGIQISEANKLISVNSSSFSGLDTPVIIGSQSTLVSTSAAGVPRHVGVNDCSFYGSLSADPLITVNGNSQFVVLSGNTLRRNNSAASVLITCNAVDVYIIGNLLRGISGASTTDGMDCTVLVPNNSSRNYAIVVKNNDVIVDGKGFDYTGGSLTGGSGTIETMEISGNRITGGVSNSIEITPGALATNPPITTVIVNDNYTDGDIYTFISNATPVISLLRMSDNRCAGIYVWGDATVRGIAETAMDENHCAGTLTVSHVPVVRINGGRTTGAFLIDEVSTIDINDHNSDGGAVIDNTSYEGWLLINGGRFSGGSNGLEFDASDAAGSNFNISSAAFASASGNALEITGVITSGIIDGCHCVVAGGADCIELAGDAGTDMDQVTVSNCVLQGGVIGIDASNNSVDVLEIDNRFISCTTNVDGTIQRSARNLQRTVEVSTAEILLLATSPKTLIPRTSGKRRILDFAVIRFNYDTAPFIEPSSPDNLSFIYLSATPQSVSASEAIVADNFLAGAVTNDKYVLSFGVGFNAAAGPGTDWAQEDIALANSGTDYTGGGSSTLTVTIFYTEEDI